MAPTHTPMHGVPAVPVSDENPAVSAMSDRAGYSLDQRVLLLERDQEQLERDTKRSLHAGNQAFSRIEHESAMKFERIEQDLKEILGKIERKPISVLQGAGLLLTALALGGGIVFAAGQASVAVKGVDGIVEQVVKLRIDNARIFDRLDAIRAFQGAKP